MGTEPIRPMYREGGIDIYHGDNRDVLASLPDGCVQIVVTSPPYNAGIDKMKPSGMHKENPSWVHKMASGYADSMSEDEYQSNQIDLLNELYRVVDEQGSCFYNHKIRWREKKMIHPLEWIIASKWNVRQEIIWDRGGGMMLNARMFYLQDERVYWLCKDEWRWNQEAVNYGTVWRIAPTPFKKHACVFPEPLVGRCLAAVYRHGDTVLDPYSGSGTTLKVAKDLGLRGIGIEQDARYVEVIIDRLRQEALPLWGDGQTSL